MTLKIIENKIVGTIDNLEEKLEGKLPVNRLELLYLVNSWGRSNSFQTSVSNYNQIEIKACEPLECYNLSKLDVSKITNMERLFMYSNFTDIYSTNRIGFHNNIHSSNGVGLHNDIHSTNGIGLHNGDISNWNTSKVTNMYGMFDSAIKFNGNINSWDTSKVTNMYGMFFKTELFNSPLNNWNTSNVTIMANMFYNATSFNQPLNNWNTSNVVCTENMFCNAISFDQNISSWNLENAVNCYCMFLNANAFMSKYNSGEDLSYYTDEIKEWLINNREKMSDIDLKDKYGKEIDMFFNKFTDINSIDKI